MPYRFSISAKAIAQLRALPKEIRQNIGWRMDALQENFEGDIKKLSAQGNRYRLRVGSYRVLFLLEGDSIWVYSVRDRKEVYE